MYLTKDYYATIKYLVMPWNRIVVNIYFVYIEKSIKRHVLSVMTVVITL